MVFGFPYETVTTDAERDELMGQILKYFGIKKATDSQITNDSIN
jgi:hypothetical protein